MGGQWEVAYHWVVLVCRSEKKNDIKAFWKRTWRVSGSAKGGRDLDGRGVDWRALLGGDS